MASPPLINTSLERGAGLREGTWETVSNGFPLAPRPTSSYTAFMSLHSYSRVWLHLTWATLERRPLLFRSAAVRVSEFLTQYAAEKGIYLKINYVNPDHVHVLMDLPTHLPIEEVMHLFKGASSHWINENNLVPGKFGWGRGYGAFSVSHSGAGEVAAYIANQEEHHRKRSFAEELQLLVERYGLKWHGA